MALEADHIELANRNHDTLAYLAAEVEQHSEWVATVAFYKAVQVVEAVFAAHSKSHSHSHDARLSRLKLKVYSGLFKPYRHLYAASLVARYLEDASATKLDSSAAIKKYSCFSDYIAPDEVMERLVRKRLHPLEEIAVGFLSEAGKASLKRAWDLIRPDPSTDQSQESPKEQ